VVRPTTEIIAIQWVYFKDRRFPSHVRLETHAPASSHSLLLRDVLPPTSAAWTVGDSPSRLDEPVDIADEELTFAHSRYLAGTSWYVVRNSEGIARATPNATFHFAWTLDTAGSIRTGSSPAAQRKLPLTNASVQKRSSSGIVRITARRSTTAIRRFFTFAQRRFAYGQVICGRRTHHKRGPISLHPVIPLEHPYKEDCRHDSQRSV